MQSCAASFHRFAHNRFPHKGKAGHTERSSGSGSAACGVADLLRPSSRYGPGISTDARRHKRPEALTEITCGSYTARAADRRGRGGPPRLGLAGVFARSRPRPEHLGPDRRSAGQAIRHRIERSAARGNEEDRGQDQRADQGRPGGVGVAAVGRTDHADGQDQKRDAPTCLAGDRPQAGALLYAGRRSGDPQADGPAAPARRRATPQELQGLAELATTDLPEIKGVPTVRSVLAAVDTKLEALAPYAIEDRLLAELRDHPLDVPRGASLMDAMELLVKQTPGTWYPWGKYLVVVTKPTLVSDHLSKTMTVRYTNTDIAQVLEDIRRHSGVDFKIEPGAVERVPPEFRNIKVFWENISVEQALESLKGLTGLQYEVTDAGVTISNSLPPAAATAGADPVVAMMTLDNGMQVMLRRSELPADVQAYLKHRTEKEVENLRRMMKQEGFQPDTAAPATQPTGLATQPVSPGH